MADIFICYSSNDRDIALKLKQIFIDRGWTVFIDQDIGTGRRFHVEIERELAQARAVVALWSKTSRESDYVLDEATEGKDRDILVPAVIEDIKPPYGFRRTQTANLADWDGNSQHKGLNDQLLRSLSRLLDGETGRNTDNPNIGGAIAKPRQNEQRSDRSFLQPGEVFRDKLKDGTQGPPMIVIPAGSFLMGSPSKIGDESERPQHEVKFQHPFAIGQIPLTFAEYDVFAKAENKPLPDDKGWGRESRPVIYVSWNDARDYCQWLSDQTGREYRLPSEAEWEYAARACTTTNYWWGDEPGRNLGNFYGSGSEWSSKQTSPVDAFKPNPFGLFDVHGNVWEWCMDHWHDDYTNAPDDGSAWIDESDGRRVVRGGSWFNGQDYARAACRNRNHPDSRYDGLGFRLCRSSPIISE